VFVPALECFYEYRHHAHLQIAVVFWKDSRERPRGSDGDHHVVVIHRT
jgi:hypothetical protein